MIEEAPSPSLSSETRAIMGEHALALAKAVKLQSAATVEFLLDRSGNIYFLEMNQRLPTNHAVTELTTGLDLVEQQIRVAAGQPLTFDQKDVQLQVGGKVEICGEFVFVRSLDQTSRYF